jgi:potassium-transporting ATPase KdpC subunit
MRKNLLNELRTAVIAIVTLTVILGVVYPLVMTGLSQVIFPGHANGSKIEVNGKVVGSKLIAKPFVIDTGKKDSDGNPITQPNPRYFQPRPSATGYNPAGTFFANRGPNQRSARAFYRQNLAAYIALERRFNPGLTARQVPVDAVTDSASGVDPHISKANARIQARRVAAVRRMPLARVQSLVEKYTDGRSLGVLGEPGVNVLELNLALDRESA